MSVKVIAELHPIKRTRVKVTTSPKVIAEIIKDLNTGFPLSQARVCRNGEIVKDFSIAANDGDTLSVRFVPYGSTQDAGTGMKIGGWALTGIGVALLFTPAAGVGVALVGTGIGMIAGGTVLLNVNIPGIPSLKDHEKPENDPSIRGAKNQARPHGRIPVLFGKHRLYPDLAANPHTQIIDGKQYYTQLFCGGYKDCVIDKNSFKLGETYLTDLSQTKNIDLILLGADPVIRLEILQNGGVSSLYPHCIHEDAINAPLQNQIDGAGGGKISGELTRTTPDNTDAINVDIFFYNGLGKYNDNGSLGSRSVEIRASYKPFGAPDSAYEILGYFNNGSNTISGSELKTKRCQITKSDLPIGQYTVKIERVTLDSTDSKIIDQVYVGSIRSIKSKDKDRKVVRPIREERQKDLTVIALRVLATSQMNGMLDSFNYVATAKMPVCSGGGSGALNWLYAAETRNPASALLYALQGRPAQQSVNDGDIDWHSFEEFYTWCEKHKYECNAYLSESVTIAELLRMIGGTARADILRIDSKISVVQDIERASHVQLFTPKNTVAYSVTMLNADIPDAIALQFIDEDAGCAQNELKVYNTPDCNRAAEPDTVQKADLWGVSNSKQARRIGVYNYACLKNRPFVHTIETDIEYMICNKGDWIQYAGDLALTGAVQGRVTEALWSGPNCIGVRLDEQVVTEPGKRYALRMRLSNGLILLQNIAAVNESGNAVYFETPIRSSPQETAPQKGDVYAFGVRGYEVIDLIITDIQPRADLSAVLTCVEYSPEIFGVDDPYFILPEFENKITPVSSAVDSGTIGTDQWQNFTTYHDGEDQPPRPSGDGQDDGWHLMQTVQSKWVSTKRALFIEDGAWGPPIKIKGEDGKYTDYRFAKNALLNVAPEFAGQDEDNPGENWTDIPPQVNENEYLWMTLSDWRNGQRLTLWSLPTRISGPVGPTGQNAVYLDLDNENHSIACFSNGTPKPGALGFEVNATVYEGMSAVPGVQVTWQIITDAAGIEINNAGTITVSASAVLGDVTLVTVMAIYNAASYFATLTLVKVKDGSAGMNGNDAVVFVLQPSVNVVKRNQSGALDPPTVSCFQFRHEGDQITTSTELLKYRLSNMAEEAKYPVGGVNIGTALWVEFLLYGGSGMLLDRERVPVVADGLGIDSVPANAWAYLSCDEIIDRKVIDNSGNEKHGVISGNIQLIDGKFGNGLQFSGSSYAQIQELFTPTGDFTISFWINKQTTSTDEAVLSNYVSSGGLAVMARANGNVEICIVSSGALRILNITAASGVIQNNTWAHVLIKYSSSTRIVRAKINGVLFSTTLTLPAQITWSAYKFTLGSNSSESARRYTGKLDEIALFEYLTTDDQDTALFNGWNRRIAIDGNYHELRYIRAAARPATPTGDSPTGWTTDPSNHTGPDPLWMTRGIKNASGVLQGAWSLPVQISGENGLGIDSIPKPYAYWSCDDPIDRIEDRTWSTYQSSFMVWQSNGWTANNGNLSVTGGKLKFAMTGTDPFIVKAVDYSGGVIYFRLSGDFVVEACSLWRSDNTYAVVKTSPGTNELKLYNLSNGYFAIMVPNENFTQFRIDPHSGSAAVGLTVYLEFLYISPAPYMGLLSDNSGNGRHMFFEPGNAQIPTDRGNGLQFLGTGAAYMKDTFYPAGDFTWSFWINKDSAASSGDQYIIGNPESGGCDLRLRPSGAITLEAYSNGAYSNASIPLSRVPNNTWLHIILKYNSETRTFKFKINNVLDSVTLTLPAQISWPTNANGVPLTLGANPGPFKNTGIPGLSGYFYGQLDKVAIFTYATTDREDEALCKTTLEKKFTSAVTSWDERYMGATNTPDLTNSGFINGRRMNPGNYVMYTGAQQGTGANIWRAAFLYQWLGTRWVELSREQNYDKYLDGVSDLTSDAPEGVFSTAFIKTLFAQTLNSDFVNVRTRLKVGSASDAIEIDGKLQQIKSGNYDPGNSGFLIQKNGNAEFNEVLIRGSFSGKLIEKGHLYIHNSHVLESGRISFREIYNFLVGAGLKYDSNFRFVKCSGYISSCVDYLGAGDNFFIADYIETVLGGDFYIGGVLFSFGNQPPMPLEMHIRNINSVFGGLCKLILM